MAITVVHNPQTRTHDITIDGQRVWIEGTGPYFTDEQFQALSDILHPRDTADVTRVVIIARPSGEDFAYTKEFIGYEVTLDVQDKGRTLKVFLNEAEDADEILGDYLQELRASLKEAAQRVIDRDRDA
jgi:hypothetical protein